jgi:Amt family ammonium transporter
MYWVYGRCTAYAVHGVASPRVFSAAKALGGVGGVSIMSQLHRHPARYRHSRCRWSFIVYSVLKKTVGIRLDAEDEFIGADLSIHKISATAERESGW